MSFRPSEKPLGIPLRDVVADMWRAPWVLTIVSEKAWQVTGYYMLVQSSICSLDPKKHMYIWLVVTGIWFLCSHIYIYTDTYIYIYIYIQNNDPNWRTHIFRKVGIPPTRYVYPVISLLNHHSAPLFVFQTHIIGVNSIIYIYGWISPLITPLVKSLSVIKIFIPCYFFIC